MQQRLNDPRERVFASVVSVYEIHFKLTLGKLSLPPNFDLVSFLQTADVSLIDVTTEHARVASQLPVENRDPWDRIIVAQCLVDGHQLVSCDENITKLGIGRIW